MGLECITFFHRATLVKLDICFYEKLNYNESIKQYAMVQVLRYGFFIIQIKPGSWTR